MDCEGMTNEEYEAARLEGRYLVVRTACRMLGCTPGQLSSYPYLRYSPGRSVVWVELDAPPAFVWGVVRYFMAATFDLERQLYPRAEDPRAEVP